MKTTTLAIPLTMMLGSVALPAHADDRDNCRWSSLGSGIDGMVLALAVFDDGTGPALYAGGQFTLAGDIVAHNIAKWDGSDWHPVGGGMNGHVNTLVTHDDGSGPALYAGGHFTAAGGAPAFHLAKWDGDAWTSVGDLNGAVLALDSLVDDADGVRHLYASGVFTVADGVPANRIACWSDGQWSALGSGIDELSWPWSNSLLWDLAPFMTETGPALYASAPFTTVGGNLAQKVALWSDGGWTSLGGSSSGQIPIGNEWDGAALCLHDDGTGPAVYVGGWFYSAGGVDTGHIARWNGSDWSSVGGGIPGWNLRVNAITEMHRGDELVLVAAGAFSSAGGVSAQSIASWNGQEWSAFGLGIQGPSGVYDGVRTMVIFDDGSGPALYVGGEFHTAGGRPVNRIARFGPFCDCNANGLPDSEEIADGTLADCDGNGIPDTCELLASHTSETRTPFSATSPVTLTIDEPQPAADTVSIEVVVRGDLGGLTRFATLSLDGEPVATLFAIDGEACPTEPQRRTVELSADEFNTHVGDGLAVFDLVPSGPVGECDFSLARIEVSYTTFPDCNANGIPDSCDIVDGTLADCNRNGQPDSCEMTSWPTLDCDGDGHLDECQIADDPALDVNGDGILDACTIAIGDFTLDGVVNGGDLAVLLSVWGSDDADIGDLTGDGLIDGADLTHLLGNWGAYQGGWYTILELLPPPEVIVDVEVRSRIAATGLPWRIRDIGSGIEMLLVPPGTFMMGCSPSNQFGCDADENPVHEVTLTQAFYLGRYEVTQAQWATVMNNNPSHFQTPSAEVPADQVPLRPVEKTSWTMIQDFEAATGLRLPTEAEWEYACRAGTQTAFNLPPNGTNDDGLLAQLAWFGQQGGFQTHPVGQKQANKLGLHDMHGNVQEWCEDWYDHAYYATSPTDDPPGPSRGVARVVRGGYWYYGSSNCRSPHRTPTSPSYASSFFGFRAARTP